MFVERTDKEVIIRLPVSVDTEDLQDLLNYARYKELTANFKVDKKKVDKLQAASMLNGGLKTGTNWLSENNC
jgi:hypothetical protein